MINGEIYKYLTSEEYHGEKSSISRSALMDFKKSPRKYWANYLNPDRPAKEPTPAMEFGTAFHTFILERHLFADNYFIMPPKVLLKEVGREAYDEYKKAEQAAEQTKKKVLTQATHLQLLDMRTALYENPRAAELIQGAVYESSYFWKDEESGLMVKSRPDILHKNMYVDLKTCSDASPHAYQRDMALGGYHIQAAMVSDGVLKLTGERLLACINICVEKNYPYSIGIYIIDESAIEAGREEYKRLLIDMNACIRDNDYPDYEVQTLGLPRWANY
jgi:hypothetical protein